MKEREERHEGTRKLPPSANLSYLSPASVQSVGAAARKREQRLRSQLEKLLTNATSSDRMVTLPTNQSEGLYEACELIWSSDDLKKVLRTSVSEGLETAGFDDAAACSVMMDQFETELLSNQQVIGPAQRLAKQRKAEASDVSKDQALGRRGRRWSHATIRMCLAVWARCPAAFRALQSFQDHMNLPAEKTLFQYAKSVRQSDGTQGSMLELFRRTLAKAVAEDPDLNVTDVALYWDEVKLVSKLGFATNGQVRTCCSRCPLCLVEYTPRANYSLGLGLL